MHLDKDTMIGDILDLDNGCESIFLSQGMACLGCPAARGETIGEACQVHGVDPEILLAELKAHFAK